MVPKAEPQRLDVQLVLKPMQHFVANGAVITQADQCDAFGINRLMTQSAEGIGRFLCTLRIHGRVRSKTFEPAPIMDTQPIDMVAAGQPRLIREFV